MIPSDTELLRQFRECVALYRLHLKSMSPGAPKDVRERIKDLATCVDDWVEFIGQVQAERRQVVEVTIPSELEPEGGAV